MSDMVDIEEAGRKIALALEEYDQDVADATKKVVDKVAKESVEKLKTTSPKRTGYYRENWARKKTYENTRTKRNTVYNKKAYQLTHLLEKGHASKYGGRVKAIPHIEPVEKEAIESLQKGIKEVAGK